MQWLKALNLTEIPKTNTIKTVKINGKQICIVHTEHKIYATQAYCPHAGGHLGGGWCKDGYLICPIHRYAYNLETGRGFEGQGDYINTYQTEIREDGLYIGFEESWWAKIFG